MKLSNIKHLILTTILCALTVFTAKAQSCLKTNGIVGIEADAPRVVYTLHGDMTGVTVPHATNKVFTSDAVNEVFTNNTGTSIVAGAAYDAETTYYSASKDWGEPLFNGGAPINDYTNVNNVNSNSTWNVTTVNTTNLYSITVGMSSDRWNMSDVYMYPVSGTVQETHVWDYSNIPSNVYIYNISYDWSTGIKIISSITEQNPNFTDGNWNDSKFKLNYVVSSVPLEINSQFPIAEIPDGAVWATQSDLARYYKTVSKTNVSGERIVLANSMDYSTNYSVGGNWYLKYIVSDGELTNGQEIDLSQVTLVTSSILDSYKENVQPITIGSKIDGTGAYSTPETFTYKDVTYVKYITSNTEISGTINIEDFDGQSLLTNANMSTYVNTTATYNCISDKLYVSTDGGETKTKLENGKNYTYNAGETFWTYDASYPVIENNADFFTTNASYLTAQPVPVAEYLVEHANAGGYKEVVLKSCECGWATMDQPFTCQLVHLTAAETLNMSKVQVPTLVGGGPTADGTTFKWDPNSTIDYTANNSVTKLYLPHIQNSTISADGREHRHVPNQVAAAFNGIKNAEAKKHESAVIMPDNATCIEKYAFSNMWITDITLNKGLRMVGDNAFDGMHEDVLVIPSTMEYIGKGAFGQGYVHDVYFLGTTAPIVEMDAFGSKAYVNNNANGIPNENSDPISFDKETSTVDVGKNPNYAATREFYYNGDYAAAMLHLPKNLTTAQRAAYTDVTRDYHVFDTYRNATAEEIETYGQKGSNVIKSTTGEHYYIQIIKGDGHDIEYKYIDGNETNQGKWDEETPTQDFVMRTFWNGTVGDYDTCISSLGGFTVSTYNSFNSGIPGAGITGGQTSFYDYYVGSTYHWPGQSAYNRSYVVATRNILWDGTTTIAKGIENKGGSYIARTYDINCDGDMTDDGEAKWADGSEYIGLHQFVLVTSDIEPEQTPEEIPFKTIKGGNWYSFCYPVNMTVKQVREVFGEDTQVCKFNQVDRVVEGDDKRIRLYFTNEQCLGENDINKIAISANVSYMIRPSTYFDEDDENYANMYFKFSDYQLDGKQVPQETNVKAVDISSEGKVAGDDYTFIGQYMTQADGTAITMPKYSYFLRNTSPAGTKVKNQKHKLSFQGGTTGKWNVYTSIVIPANGQEDKDVFFTGTSSQNLAKTSTFFGFAEEDKPTEVESVKYEMVLGAENNPGGIYNLNGQLLGNTTVGLKKGIYIQQGKKFIIR